MREAITTTRKAAAAIRKAGLTATTNSGHDNWKANAWIIGQSGTAVVINCQVASIMGQGCYGKPGFHETKEELTQKVMAALTASGIEFRRSPTPDQLFLSGFQPK